MGYLDVSIQTSAVMPVSLKTACIAFKIQELNYLIMNEEKNDDWLLKFSADLNNIDVKVEQPVKEPVKGKSGQTNQQRYSTYVPVRNENREYDKCADVDLVRFFLMEFLFRSRFDIVISEYEYKRTIADIYAVVENRAVEFEIKGSRSDYFTDFKKKMFVGRLVDKHSQIKSGKSGISRFYFVVPEGMIDYNEVPEYSGLIYYQLHKGIPVFRVVKPAPLITKDFLSPHVWSTISKKLMVRARNIADRYINNKYTELLKQYFRDIYGG